MFMKNSLFLFAAIALLLSGCVKSDFSKGGSTENENDWTKFPFTTVGKVNATISYQNMGGIQAPVYFEIYDQQPVTMRSQASGYDKVEGLEPVFAGVTNQNGEFKGTLELPGYMTKAYILSTSFYAQTLIVADIEGNTLMAMDEQDQAAPEIPAATTRATKYNSDVVSNPKSHETKWKTYLGSYDTTYGRINYKYTGELQAKNYAALYAAHSSVINTDKSCPTDYRSSSDLRIEKRAAVVVTFLGSNTCWNCSMGYYYYKDGEKPKSLKDANIIMIFPNTQDGQWSNNKPLSNKYKGVDRGTSVQLKYYSDINDPSTGDVGFPEGYRIGFVLACNAWQNRLTGFGDSKGYRAATSDNLSVNDNGTAFPDARTAVYRYTDASKGINSVMFSFEDYTTDDNFSDIVFTLTSNPLDAVVDIPSVDQDGTDQTVKSIRGMYAYEDLWPSRGDYDMNDVMVRANYEKTFNTRGIREESFLFTTMYNAYTGLKNGLGVSLEGIANGEVKVWVKEPKVAGATEEPAYKEHTCPRHGNVILLTEDTKTKHGSTYKITVTYPKESPAQTGGAAKPFIFRDRKDGTRWEMHLPYEAPTALADPTQDFGKGDDRSEPAKGIYYVRQEMYPFAFYLAGATEKDLSPMLDPKNETTAVDKLYPDYVKWVTSQGTTNKDWYKK